jgi:hypothetical protein
MVRHPTSFEAYDYRVEGIEGSVKRWKRDSCEVRDFIIAIFCSIFYTCCFSYLRATKKMVRPSTTITIEIIN